MKRRVSICISFLVVSLFASAQLSSEVSSWDNSDLKGKVRTVTESNYIIQNNGMMSNYSNQDIIIQDELIKNFDRNGILMNQTLVSYVGGESKKWNFTYNVQRQLVEEVVYSGTGLDEIISYFYNGNKLVKKSWFKGPNRMHQKSWFYEYGATGNLVNEYWTDAQGRVAWRSTYVYDQAGNMIEKAWYVNEQLTSKWISKYDVQGNVIENSEYVNGLLQSSEFNTYNGKRQLVGSKIFKNNKLDISKEFSYNTKGDLRMEWWYDGNGKEIHRRNFDYDKAQNMISTFTWGSNSKLLDKIYWTYDNNGNWYQRVDYEGHTPIYTVKRAIVYY